MALDISIKITKSLRSSLTLAQLNQLVKDFFEWKSLGPAGEYSSYIFGKDGFYAPPASPPQTLMHAHMIPPNNSPMRKAWNDDHHRKDRNGNRVFSRKVSNKALIYAIYTNSLSKKNTYLLIGILNDPDSHVIIKRETKLHDALMGEYVDIAQQFISDIKQPAQKIDGAIISSLKDLPIV